MLRQAEAGLKLENSFLYESFQQRQRFREDLQLSGTFQGLGHLNDLRREVTCPSNLVPTKVKMSRILT